VALSGAHSVGACHVDRSGFEGQWTEDRYCFDNSYFTEMVGKTYVPTSVEATAQPQYEAATTTAAVGGGGGGGGGEAGRTRSSKKQDLHRVVRKKMART